MHKFMCLHYVQAFALRVRMCKERGSRAHVFT